MFLRLVFFAFLKRRWYKTRFTPSDLKSAVWPFLIWWTWTILTWNVHNGLGSHLHIHKTRFMSVYWSYFHLVCYCAWQGLTEKIVENLTPSLMSSSMKREVIGESGVSRWILQGCCMEFAVYKSANKLQRNGAGDGQTNPLLKQPLFFPSARKARVPTTSWVVSG